MKCNQCDRPAMIEVGDGQQVALCLNCYKILSETIERQNESTYRELNMLYEQFDLMSGVRTTPRYQIKDNNTIHMNQNHISINDSNIGLINTGTITNLNQTIENLCSVSNTEIAETIKNFSQSVLSEPLIDAEQKNEILSSLDYVAKESLKEANQQNKPIVKTLLKGISSIVSLTANAATIWQVLHPTLLKTFGL
ncbi:hypothetical protein KA517_00905 [Candidatus Gracilibacteria bacterium]|nr:hypothetical protein [Candidatus Gracilibacteria bacterium]